MSFHENTELLVKKACLFEKEQAEKGWGNTYNSLHEGWAVLKEEVEEAEHPMKMISHQVDWLWRAIKEGLKDYPIELMEEIQGNSIDCMKELAQVWAVCEKMKNTVKEEDNA